MLSGSGYCIGLSQMDVREKKRERFIFVVFKGWSFVGYEPVSHAFYDRIRCDILHYRYFHKQIVSVGGKHEKKFFVALFDRLAERQIRCCV